MGRLMGRNEGCFSYQLGHKNGQIVRWKDFGSGSWGLQPPLFAAPRPKPSVGTPAGRVQDQDQDQEDEQEFVRSPSQPILVTARAPRTGWWSWSETNREQIYVFTKYPSDFLHLIHIISHIKHQTPKNIDISRYIGKPNKIEAHACRARIWWTVFPVSR